jgi:DNA-binding LytR/AlgR family response regulator
MEYHKEQTGILVFEEDATFKTILGSMLQALGYQRVFIAGTLEESIELLHSEAIMACLICLNDSDAQQQGLKLGGIIREQGVNVSMIFLTKLYDEALYMLCRPLQPSAFLNKELSAFKLKIALDQAFLHHFNEEQSLSDQKDELPLRPAPLFFKTAKGYISVPVKNIYYFYSNQKITHVRTEQHTYDTQVQLQMLEENLGDQFIRIHKSYMINISYIEAIQPNESSVMIGGETLPIGYAYRKSFFNRIKLLR